MRWMKGCLDAVSDASTLSHKFAFEWLIIVYTKNKKKNT